MGELGFGAGHHEEPKPGRSKKGAAKAAKKKPGKKKAAKKKTGKGKPKLDPRRARYVKARKEGKSKYEAGLVAGFAPSTAKVAKAKIETPEVEAEIEKFQADICSAFPNARLIEKLEEGLEATTVKVATIFGEITDMRAFVDHAERRAHVELIAEMSGRLGRKGVQVNVQQNNINYGDRNTNESSISAILSRAAERIERRRALGTGAPADTEGSA